ncbi:MAG: 23S rRNA (guanosine(2251)-2'-O)-methyltransferase RlmB [Oscillospiraceae bacterium]|nr:23S rRNA (guanosine(2251)-2'-O)-methyltransferase RlmB [Oscillospiraceae bacterium]
MIVKKRKSDMLEGQDNSYISYGRNAVLELLKSERPVDVIYVEYSDNSKQTNYYVALAKQKNAVIKRVPTEKLESICLSSNHQGVVAISSVIEYVEVVDILEVAKQKGKLPFILMLDGIEDPHNLGAIIRTAEVAGADGLIIPKRRNLQINQTVARVSTGAVNYLPIARVANLASTVRELKKAGVFCFAADMNGQSVYTVDFMIPTLLIIGSEGEGVSHLLKQLSDYIVSLPIYGRINSLNASVAAGALMYEIVRQRNTADIY